MQTPGRVFWCMFALFGCVPRAARMSEPLPSTMSVAEGLEKCEQPAVSGTDAGADTLWCEKGGSTHWFGYDRASQVLSAREEVSVQATWHVGIPSDSTREIWWCPRAPNFWVAFSADQILVKPVEMAEMSWERVTLEEPFSFVLYTNEIAPPRDVTLDGTLSVGVGRIPEGVGKAHLPEFDGDLGVTWRRGGTDGIPTQASCKRWFVAVQ